MAQLLYRSVVLTPEAAPKQVSDGEWQLEGTAMPVGTELLLRDGPDEKRLRVTKSSESPRQMTLRLSEVIAIDPVPSRSEAPPPQTKSEKKKNKGSKR